ncbi:MAG: ornithine carbamoyltransferase [Nitrospiraceae bacterium]|nr:ornithine carbamoyltransferase [Nitrospira sp.]MCA9455622.1 ornithine carbamoyltransferase [Nitrospira sp.]MCB9774464.1 ornithine carbamoyltransferase [Nitrospiraceae bacterium]
MSSPRQSSRTGKSTSSAQRKKRTDLPKDLLTVADIPRNTIHHLIALAQKMKAARTQGRTTFPLKGKTLGLIFEKPSTRTRVSFEAGMNQLGGQAIFLASEKIQLSRGESLADTAKVLTRYLDGLVVRTFNQTSLEEWARHTSIPVINGLTDDCHPCQALADLLTIVEHRVHAKGLKLAYIGDGNNITHSLIEIGAKVGMHVTVGCPQGYEPDPHIVEAAQKEGQQTGARIEITHDPNIAATDADVIYTDVWISMGQEHQQEPRMEALAPYQVNGRLMQQAKPDALLMHCLPAHRGEEITEDVLDGPQSVVLDQAENRLHIQKAILLQWLGRSPL